MEKKIGVAMYGAEDIVFFGDRQLVHLKEVLTDTFFEKNGITIAKFYRANKQDTQPAEVKEETRVEGSSESIFRK
jgi:hypothetical protein